MADVGGTAGFMLGMSIATCLAVADFIISNTIATVTLIIGIICPQIKPIPSITYANKNIGTD